MLMIIVGFHVNCADWIHSLVSLSTISFRLEWVAENQLQQQQTRVADAAGSDVVRTPWDHLPTKKSKCAYSTDQKKAEYEYLNQVLK